MPVLQETLKDARSANADMDDESMSSSRQAARLRHALEESQAALKAAQAALAQVRLRGVGVVSLVVLASPPLMLTCVLRVHTKGCSTN